MKVKFKTISAGRLHSLAIDENGGLWAWGDNTCGQIGLGVISTKQPYPIQIKPEVKFSSISAGDLYSLAIDVDNNLWAWGNNWYGQLGDGTTTNRDLPVLICDNIEIASAGCWGTVAIDVEGEIWISYDKLLVKVESDKRFVKLSCGWRHCLGIDINGNLWASEDSKTFKRIIAKSSFGETSTNVEVSAGYGHSLAIDMKGNLWAWGNNSSGQLGDKVYNISSSPIPIMVENTFKAISAGKHHSLAIDKTGQLWSWGNNDSWQLGLGYPNRINTPTEVINNNKFVSIAAGGFHSLAIDSKGNLWAWGDNTCGQIGNDYKVKMYPPVILDVIGELVGGGYEFITEDEIIFEV